MSVHCLKTTAACLLLLLIGSNIPATEYFVFPQGDDSNIGTESAPFASIEHGLRQLRPADTLSILSGTYTPQAKPSIWSGGTAQAPILIRGVGETIPVIDASGYTGDWPHGLEIGAPYIRLENLHIKNAKSVGISVWKTHHVAIVQCIVSGSWATGIGIQSDTLGGTRAVVVQECEVYNNVLMNTPKTMNGGWGSGIGAGHCRNITLRNNLVYENYGEGLLAYLCDTVTIAGNVSRDNFSVSLYIDNTRDAVVERNFAYSTGDTAFYRNDLPAAGFQIANETEGYNFTNPSQRTTVQNNLFVNQRNALYYGNYQGGGGLKEFYYRCNTAWNSLNASVHIDQDNHQNVVIESNVFVQTQNLPHVRYLGLPGLITARNNIWYGGTDAYPDGEGDLFLDPLLPGGGTFDPAGYVPPINSPAALNGGEVQGVTVDFFGTTRSAPFAIGAFVAAPTSGLQSISSAVKQNQMQLGNQIRIRHTSKNLYVNRSANISSQIVLTLTNLQGRIMARVPLNAETIALPKPFAEAIVILTLSDTEGRGHKSIFRIMK